MDKQEAIKILKEFHDKSALFSVRTALETVFPELKEDEDELEWLKQFIQEEVDSLSIDIRDNEDQFRLKMLKRSLEWLEKQGEQKSILNVPLREVILSIWDLGNEWKELTNGSISTEYGTQLDYIQKHWTESEYYLREKQDEQTINQPDFEIPFGAKDSELIEESYYIPKGFHAEIIKDRVTIKKGEQKPAWSAEDTFKVQRICKYLCEAKKYYADITEVRDCIEWLKSLKQRIGG